MAGIIFLTLVPIFFVLAVGYGAGGLGIVDNQNVDSLNVLVMTFALPAALFVATRWATTRTAATQFAFDMVRTL